MRKLALTVAIGLLYYSGIIAQETFNFPIKSGIIKFADTGFIVGRATLYFDDFGKTICEDFVGTIWEVDTHASTIFKNGMVYILDWDSKTYITEEMLLRQAKIMEEFYLDEKKLKEKGYEKESEQEILGKICQVYLSNSEFKSRVWLWNGFILKKTIDLVGGSNHFAIAIEETAPNAEVFEIPSDFKEE